MWFPVTLSSWICSNVRAGFMGMWPALSHVAVCLEEPCSWFNALLPMSWNSWYFLNKDPSCNFVLHRTPQIVEPVLSMIHGHKPNWPPGTPAWPRSCAEGGQANGDEASTISLLAKRGTIVSTARRNQWHQLRLPWGSQDLRANLTS